MSMSVKKGDNVVVIAGKDKGKTGKVQEVFLEDNRVLVDGINIVTKHKKARNQQEKSGIIKKNAPIDASNVMVVCPACGKATRVYHKVVDGKKVRVCKCGVSLDKEYVKASKKDAKKAKAETAVKAEKTEKVAKTTEKVEKTAPKTANTAKTTVKAEKTVATKTAAKAEAKPAVKTAQKKEPVAPQKSKTTTKKDA